MDSIYFYDSSSLFVQLFISSKLTWSQKGITITQSTTYPVSDTSTITISSGSGSFAMKIRIPAWTSGAQITVNGASAGVTITSGSYASISRTWATGDVVKVKIPLQLRAINANDNSNLAAVAYGPVVLCGNYGSQTLSAAPTLTLGSVTRVTTASTLQFTATANGATVTLVPMYDGQGFNYVVYWAKSGSLPTTAVTPLPTGTTGTTGTTVQTTPTTVKTTASATPTGAW